MDASDEVTFGVECLNINSQQEIQPSNCAENDILLEKWKFSLPELYKISLKFFKGKKCSIMSSADVSKCRSSQSAI